MLEIIVIIFAIVTLIRGKFSLSKGRELLGWRARLCGCILLTHLGISFVAGVILGLTGNASPGLMLAIGFCSLITVVIVAMSIGSALYKGQMAELANANPSSPQIPGA
ncbi:MAG TPA: hypothetical protein VFY13_08865 [Luteolibacter sp.]|nr:hypothetical protein [Luteolibacter sp.]